MASSTQFSNSISQAKRSASEATDKMKQAGSAASEEAGGLLQSAQEAAGDLAHKTQEGMGYLKDKASDYIGQGRKGMEAFGETVQGEVQYRPISALLLALGAGALLGAAVAISLRR